MLYFSGFSSQGDGACFTCSDIDFKLFLDGKYKDIDISANITHNSRYYYPRSTIVNVDINGEEIPLPEINVSSFIKFDKIKKNDF